MHTIIIAVTRKIPKSPLSIMGKVDKNCSVLSIFVPPKKQRYAGIKLRINPPAITDAICPDTFAPIVCISKKF